MVSKYKLTIALGLILAASLATTAHAALPEFSKTGLSMTIKSESTTLETITGIKVKCGTASAKAEITGAKTVGSYAETYKSCESSAAKCSSSGAGSGEVKTATLKGELGYTNKSKKEVGLRLESAKGKESDLAEFTCGETKVIVKGAVIGAFAPVNTETNTFKHTLEGSKGVQSIKKFEGGLEEVLTTSVGGGEATNCDIININNVVVSTPIIVIA